MKRVARRVEVDRGYDLAEYWVVAKVIRSQMCKDLFTDSLKEQLLVELLGGERVWVAFWRELPNAPPSSPRR